MNWKYILIVIVLATIVGGGALAYQYWWLPKEAAKISETKPPEVKTPKDETANWKTYKNEEYGFEIKYPQDASIHAEQYVPVSGTNDMLGDSLLKLTGEVTKSAAPVISKASPIISFKVYTPSIDPYDGSPFNLEQYIARIVRIYNEPKTPVITSNATSEKLMVNSLLAYKLTYKVYGQNETEVFIQNVGSVIVIKHQDNMCVGYSGSLCIGYQPNDLANTIVSSFKSIR